MKDNRTEFNDAHFLKIPIVGILRGIGLAEVMQILPLCISAGLRTIEITLNTPGATDIIKQAAKHFAGQINIGAGTVCNVNELELALNIGAGFIVTPNLDEQVITTCLNKGVPIFPGAFTPTEIYHAWNLGATMVKVFPADTLGPKFISNVKAPLQDIKLLPTGGIDIGNVMPYFKAGASGVGVSGGLFNNALIAKKEWELLSKHLTDFADKLAGSDWM